MQYVLKEARVFDIWGKICPIMLSDAVLSEAEITCKRRQKAIETPPISLPFFISKH